MLLSVPTDVPTNLPSKPTNSVSRSVGTPQHQKQLLNLSVICALALLRVFVIVESVSALALSTFGQVGDEVIVSGIPGSNFLDDDHLFILDVVDDVAVQLLLFHLIEAVLALLAHCNSGGHGG